MPVQVDNIYALLAVVVLATPAIVGSIFSGLAYIQARRAAAKANETHISLVETKQTVENVEKATNGMKDQLVKATEQAALAAGIAQGKALEKARADAETLAKMHKDP